MRRGASHLLVPLSGRRGEGGAKDAAHNRVHPYASSRLVRSAVTRSSPRVLDAGQAAPAMIIVVIVIVITYSSNSDTHTRKHTSNHDNDNTKHNDTTYNKHRDNNNEAGQARTGERSAPEAKVLGRGLPRVTPLEVIIRNLASIPNFAGCIFLRWEGHPAPARYNR